MRYVYLFLANWYWFFLAVFITVGTAYLVNNHSVKIYKVTASLLIEDDKGSSETFGSSGGGDVISGFGLYPSMKNLQNQILILQSRSQVARTLKELDFEVSYFKDEVFSTREVYYETPFVVIPDFSKLQPLGVTFKVTFLSDSTMKLESEMLWDQVTCYNYLSGKTAEGPGEIEIDKVVRFGETIEDNGYSFALVPRDGAMINGNGDEAVYLFSFNSQDDLLSTWSGRISLETLKQEASMVNLSIETECPAKAQLFLDKHLEMYLQRTLDKKNQFANNTINFIDRQLSSIADSLNVTEKTLQNFKRNNQVVDLSFQAQQLFEQTKELGNQKAELKIKDDYYNYLLEYLGKNREAGDLLAPSVMGISDPLLNNLVLQINKMADQKISMENSEARSNPYMATLESQVRNAKATLEENTRNMVNNNNLAISDIDRRLNALMEDVRKLPQTERELFGIERQFKLNDYIYSYLLQRRAEAQIAKASNTPDNEIIDRSRVIQPYIRPRPARNYGIAMLAGLAVPALALILISLFNNKITSEEDFKRFTDLPVAGHIIHSIREYQTVVLTDPKSQVAETFRSLRTRLQFFTKDTPSPVILITSSMPAEGKTFASVNLASACSLAGKKTILVGFDLRKPRLYSDFGLTDDKGVSTWLIGRDKINDIIQESGYENLSVIAAGPVPPNPSELAASEKTKELFAELKKKFDYIILDSAPIGTVSDTFSLAAAADITIILVRHNKTIKNVLENTLSDAKSNGITGMSILLNDISRDSTIYGYGRYKYGYGYGYEYSNGEGKQKS
jgi:capsular exopolysaccharide synthesis family protein